MATDPTLLLDPAFCTKLIQSIKTALTRFVITGEGRFAISAEVQALFAADPRALAKTTCVVDKTNTVRFPRPGEIPGVGISSSFPCATAVQSLGPFDEDQLRLCCRDLRDEAQSPGSVPQSQVAECRQLMLRVFLATGSPAAEALLDAIPGPPPEEKPPPPDPQDLINLIPPRLYRAPLPQDLPDDIFDHTLQDYQGTKAGITDNALRLPTDVLAENLRAARTLPLGGVANLNAEINAYEQYRDSIPDQFLDPIAQDLQRTIDLRKQALSELPIEEFLTP